MAKAGPALGRAVALGVALALSVAPHTPAGAEAPAQAATLAEVPMPTRDELPAQAVLLRGSFARARAVFADLLAGRDPGDGAAELGLVGEPRGDGLVLLREPAGERTGLGSYLLRRGGAALLLQAPHADTDLDTGRLVELLMTEGDAAAAAWNSVPRAYEAGGRRVAADLARAPESLFNALALAFAELRPGGLVVQIHGHARERRRTEAGRTADVILSAGSREPSAVARAVAACLAERWPEEVVRLFPEQVEELGATANATGRALQAEGFGGFLHLELSRELRRRLVADRAARDGLTACLRAA